MPVLLCVAPHNEPIFPLSNRAALLTQVPQCSSLKLQWKNLSIFNLEWRLALIFLICLPPDSLPCNHFQIPDLIILSHLKFLQPHFLAYAVIFLTCLLWKISQRNSRSLWKFSTYFKHQLKIVSSHLFC